MEPNFINKLAKVTKEEIMKSLFEEWINTLDNKDCITQCSPEKEQALEQINNFFIWLEYRVKKYEKINIIKFEINDSDSEYKTRCPFEKPCRVGSEQCCGKCGNNITTDFKKQIVVCSYNSKG